MRTTTITLRIRWDEAECDDPALWDWASLTDLAPEQIEILRHETERASPQGR